MQLGMIGVGRMGGNMVLRLMKAGHECVVYGLNEESIKDLVDKGAKGTTDLNAFAGMLSRPRAVWLMVPAAAVDKVLDDLTALLEPGDIVVDGGNSYYHDDIRRAAALKEERIQYVDVGVSGGVWGLERGYCMMIGGEAEAVQRLDPIFKALAPGVADAPRTPGRTGEPTTAENGYLHCGPNGGGHFVKMVHNGIEYGIMAAFAEGLNIIKNADIGSRQQEVDARPRRCVIPSCTNQRCVLCRCLRSGYCIAIPDRARTPAFPLRCPAAPIWTTPRRATWLLAPPRWSPRTR